MMASKFFVFSFADVEVREQEFVLVKAGETLPVEPKAFRVLLVLLRNPGKLIGKEELLNAVWGDAIVTDNSLARSIALLRRLLGDETRNPRYIETVATVGYRFVCKVKVEEESAGAEGAPVESAVAPGADQKIGSQRQTWTWALAGAAALALCLVCLIWYLCQPLPPPRITAYTQLTRDGRSKQLAGTDGSRLYFTQISPMTPKQVGVNGGDAAPVSLAIPETRAILTDVSSDGATALVYAYAPTDQPGSNATTIWLASLIGGSARRLGYGLNPAFSPDGLSFIYSTVSGDIFLARIDGTENRKLAHMALPAYSFSWSPDRKSIRFIANGLLWEMASNGSGLHQLLHDWQEPGSKFWGRWTPDGRFYLFTLGHASSALQIWALDERRRLFGRQSPAPIRLTTGPMGWGLPIGSRGGTKIFADGATLRGELSRIDPKTGVLQPFLGGVSAEMVAFSPDGKSVAYVSYPDGTLWRANRDGSNRVQLADAPDPIYQPRWSPDSKQIVYATSSPYQHSKIYLISADGGESQKLLPAETADMGDPNWSSDGKRVVFDWSDSPNPYGTSDLRILELDSRRVSVIPDSTNMFSPRWSPDGRYIVAMWRRQSLPIFDFKVQKWSELRINGDVEFPCFSHDTRYVYFLRFGLNQGVFRIPVNGGKEERVVDLSKSQLTGLFNFSMSLDPTDLPLVLRDVSSDDIYALTLEEK